MKISYRSLIPFVLAWLAFQPVAFAETSDLARFNALPDYAPPKVTRLRSAYRSSTNEVVGLRGVPESGGIRRSASEPIAIAPRQSAGLAADPVLARAASAANDAPDMWTVTMDRVGPGPGDWQLIAARPDVSFGVPVTLEGASRRDAVEYAGRVMAAHWAWGPKHLTVHANNDITLKLASGPVRIAADDVMLRVPTTRVPTRPSELRVAGR